MARVAVKITANTTSAEIRSAGAKYFNAIFSDVLRQASDTTEADVLDRLRNRVNKAIEIELREMGRVLLTQIIGGDVNRKVFLLPTDGPQIWSEDTAKPTAFDYTSAVGWKKYSPAYEASKRKRYPGRWQKWFLATGKLREELRASNLFTPAGLGRMIDVKIVKRGRLSEGEITRLGDALGPRAERPESRGRTGRLRLFDVKLRIFTGLTPADLPYLSSGNIGDINSGGNLLQKLGLSADATRKLGPPSRHEGTTHDILMPERKREVFQPLLQFWMAQRIPTAVAKALYEPSGRRS